MVHWPIGTIAIKSIVEYRCPKPKITFDPRQEPFHSYLLVYPNHNPSHCAPDQSKSRSAGSLRVNIPCGAANARGLCPLVALREWLEVYIFIYNKHVRTLMRSLTLCTFNVHIHSIICGAQNISEIYTMLTMGRGTCGGSKHCSRAHDIHHIHMHTHKHTHDQNKVTARKSLLWKDRFP